MAPLTKFLCYSLLTTKMLPTFPRGGSMFNRIRFFHVMGFLLLGIMAISIVSIAQTQSPAGPVMRFTATTANVSGAPDSVRIDVLAWSSDAGRDQLVAAWNLTAPA